MEENFILKKIAVIHTDFPEKFGVPRQSGLAAVKGRIVFEPEYRNPDALRGIEDYSHLWILWGFSQVPEEEWRPTVRPPRLGGNRRMGVFATRSPFRPNPIGLSCVELESFEKTAKEGIVLHVKGADMVDKTPIYDIKPYLPYVDARPEAMGGFADQVKDDHLEVCIPEKWSKKIPEEQRSVLEEILMQDPRPSYQDDEERIYGMTYANLEVKFQVKGNQLTVCGIYQTEDGSWRERK